MRRSDAILYLRRYVNSAIPAEYAQSDSRADEFLESEAGRSAVRQFQAEFGATAIDGVLGEKTLRAMQTPRCGCTEEMLAEARASLRQHPNRNWKEQPLLWRFEKFIPGISDIDQRDVMRLCCESWMQACGIWAREWKASDPDDGVVIITTGRGRADGFDGRSGTLMYAYVAGFKIVIDIDENWTLDRDSNGTSVEEALGHEFGHTLGIGHLSSGNWMQPFYKRGLYKPQAGDAKEAQARYGKPTWTPDEPSDPTEPADPNYLGTFRITRNGGAFVGRRVEGK